ncbi:GNAT family N-acetyltransferase [Rhizobium rhizogenes]|uniref:GNAT family N-acetyltransferase n=1 Tax=Rhizobium rhizogenes TaxID=359 RepID=UPI0015722128|nr:GNAT family N-acetyltransferase [Rhizobium rhizogenes]NTF44159.1 GNAT family N-acetyltransferase [Rhizobium rhizogenes]
MQDQLSELVVLSCCADIVHKGVADILFRPMEERDSARIHDIHTDCIMLSLGKHYTSLQIRTWLEGRSPYGYLYGAMIGENYLVAEQEGLLVAFISWRGDELRSLFVCPERQKSGIGSLLLRCDDRLADVKYVQATLNAVGFYGKFGFEPVSSGYVEKRGVRIPYMHMRKPDVHPTH